MPKASERLLIATGKVMKYLERKAGLASIILKNVASLSELKGHFGVRNKLVEPAVIEPWSSLRKGRGKVE